MVRNASLHEILLLHPVTLNLSEKQVLLLFFVHYKTETQFNLIKLRFFRSIEKCYPLFYTYHDVLESHYVKEQYACK